MSRKERIIIGLILAGITILIGVDLLIDSSEGIVLWHIFSEGTVAAIALIGLFLILRGSFELNQRLIRERAEFSKFKEEAEQWKQESKKYLNGLSIAIDHQLSKWRLSEAEKEVAFLLLKGMSLKEIAEIRSTTERTARTQSIAIYSKAGLSGRSELSAFFLEDLLVPPIANPVLPLEKNPSNSWKK